MSDDGLKNFEQISGRDYCLKKFDEVPLDSEKFHDVIFSEEDKDEKGELIEGTGKVKVEILDICL